MKHDLRRPCPHCPFRTDRPGYLRRARAAEIAQDLERGHAFACHETTVDDDDEFERHVTADSQQCAGALIVLEREGRSTQLQRIAERLGSTAELDMSAPVAESLEMFVRHHEPEVEEHEPCEIAGPHCTAPAGWMEGGTIVENYAPEPTTSCPYCGSYVCEACSVKHGDERPCCDCYEIESAV